MRRLLPEPRTVSVCFHSSEPGATPGQRLTTVGAAAAVLLLVSCALTEVKRTAAITQSPIKNLRSLLFIEFAPSAVRHFQDGFWKALALNWNFQSCRIDHIHIPPLPVGRDVETEFRGNHNPVAMRRERLAHELFVRKWTVRLRRIEE